MLSRLWKSDAARVAISSLAVLAAANGPVEAAGKEFVTVSVVLALAAGEWSTEILAGADAAAKDLNGKVKVRVTGPTTFDPQRQAQNVSRRARDQAGRFDRSQRSATALYATGFGGAVERRPRGVDQRSADA